MVLVSRKYIAAWPYDCVTFRVAASGDGDLFREQFSHLRSHVGYTGGKGQTCGPGLRRIPAAFRVPGQVPGEKVAGKASAEL